MFLDPTSPPPGARRDIGESRIVTAVRIVAWLPIYAAAAAFYAGGVPAIWLLERAERRLRDGAGKLG